MSSNLQPPTPLIEQVSWRTFTYEQHAFITVNLVIRAREHLVVQDITLRTMNGDQPVAEFRCDIESGPYGLCGFLAVDQQVSFTNLVMDARGADRLVATYRFHKVAAGEDLGPLTLHDLRQRSTALDAPQVMTNERPLEIR